MPEKKYENTQKHFFEKEVKGNKSNAAPQHKGRRRVCIDCKEIFRATEPYRVRCVPCWRAWRDLVDAREAKAAPLPSPEEVAAKSTRGRQWLGYWYAENIRPKPATISWEQVDELLGDARLEDMRQDVERTSRILIK